MVERIISRLIDNAILYSEKGEIEVSIDLEKENKKEWIKISVKDEGIGLDERDKENLFKLFYRGEKATFMHPNGSGLGLFIVKNYVEAHRGKIEAKSEGRGKGSTFIVSLPVITEL
jgi:signal transduction histidine kinase